MKINEEKTKYMIFSRVNVDFTTRLTMNGTKIDKLDEIKVVGVWLTSDLKWGGKQRNYLNELMQE